MISTVRTTRTFDSLHLTLQLKTITFLPIRICEICTWNVVPPHIPQLRKHLHSDLSCAACDGLPSVEGCEGRGTAWTDLLSSVRRATSAEASRSCQQSINPGVLCGFHSLCSCSSWRWKGFTVPAAPTRLYRHESPGELARYYWIITTRCLWKPSISISI